MAWLPLLRSRLAQVLTDAGPDSATLCEGWRTRHLAAHLVLRQSDPVYGLDLVVPAFAERAERRVQWLGGTPGDEAGYASLVARVAAPPPPWHPLHWTGDLGDLLELTVHTLDVTRAGQVPDPSYETGLADAVWVHLTRTAPAMLRTWPTGVVLVRPDGTRARVRRPPAGAGTLVVRGTLADLLLWCFGRRAAADVHVEGAESDLRTLTDVQHHP